MTYEKNYWLTDSARKFLQKDYLRKGVTPEMRIREIAEWAERMLGEEGYADRFVDYMERGWISLASPVWANVGLDRGLPISCFGSYIPDDMAGILTKHAEIGMMSKYGGGTSAYFGEVRGRGAPIGKHGETSFGSVHFMELFEAVTNIVSQSSIRRGSCAAYLPIYHPDIEELLRIKSLGARIQDLSIGITIPDWWMEELIAGDKEKLRIWGLVLKKKFESGYPYIFFSDTVNNMAPDVYRDKNLTIWAGNLCNEICLPSDVNSSFVCCLSSVNAVHYHEWKKTRLVRDMTRFLDVVMTEFIDKSDGIPYLEAARNFAVNHRALGLGVLGWHTFLQTEMIPFESFEAKMLNLELFEFVKKKSYEASAELAEQFGEPELLKGYGRRNATTMAVAPNVSSAQILGDVSPGIGLIQDNYHTKKGPKGTFTYKNPLLEPLLESYGQNTAKVWKSILVNHGSVQHLEFLSELERDVFKTASEISQKEVLIQAGGRQRHIDQGQSLNLIVHPKTPAQDLSDLMIFAWKNKVKGLYYQRGVNPSQELARNLMACKGCDG